MMDSPVNISIEKLLHIDRRKSDPIYLQLVYQIINSINSGVFYQAMKMPGSRTLASILHINRQTVVKSYEELVEQGWLENKPNIGFFVKTTIAPSSKWKSNLFSQEHSNFSFHHSSVLDSPFENDNSRWQLDDGQPDYGLINPKELSRFYANALKRKNVHYEIINKRQRGNQFFKEQLVNYLKITRNTAISPENIVVGRSKEMLIYILCQLLIKRGDIVLVGDYSYFFTNMIFQQAGANIHTIPIDEEGIDPSWIEHLCEHHSVRIVCITPRGHYPTTVNLSGERRKKLVELSKKYHFIILEEDNDAEFMFNLNNPTTLMSQDTQGNTIYLGSFAKYLSPSFQAEFAIGPKDLIREIEKYLSILDPHGDIVKEQALGEMIAEGNIMRYWWKTKEIYNKRKIHFTKQLEKTFSQGQLKYSIPESGLAFWLEFQHSISIHQLAKSCLQQNLHIPRICMYQNNRKTALRIGFGSLLPHDASKVLEIIQKNL